MDIATLTEQDAGEGDIIASPLTASMGTEAITPEAATLDAAIVPEATEGEPVSIEVPALDAASGIDSAMDGEEVRAEAIVDLEAELETETEAISKVEAEVSSLDFPRSNSSPEEQPCPIQEAFQALRLQERFLSRLTSLAMDNTVVAEVVAEPAVAEAKPESAVALIAADPPAVRTVLAPNTDFLAHEIVVDDEPCPPRNGRHTSSQSSNSHSKASATLCDSPNPLTLPEDEPVPKPWLEVATGELVAGQSMHIRVKLPDLLPRIYVKLWVIDCQTRALLEPPHWLVDFTPNGFGALESHLQLTVPFGSIEVQFEAIAVEIQTQRESHKVAVTRKVIPADLPLISLDPFDL
jgi:hypothetical protein